MRLRQAVRKISPGAAVLFLAGCAGGNTQMADEGIYCYRTLADPTCYARPLPHNHDQLLGYAGPPPARPIQRVLGQSLDLPPPPAHGWRDNGPDTIGR